MADDKDPKALPKEAPKSLAETLRPYLLESEEYWKNPLGPWKPSRADREAIIQKLATLEKNALVPVELDEPRVFAKYTADGKRLVAAKSQVPLRESLAELYEVKGKVGIASGGYITLNRWAGLSLVGPLFVQTPDGEKPNPYMERDSKTGFVREVWVRRVAFGLSPLGNLAIVDRTIHFNLRTYLLQAIVAKMKETPTCAKWMPEDDLDAYQKTVNEKRKAENKAEGKDWFIMMEPPIGLWVDLSNAEIKSVLDEHVQRLKFAERHATSICERKALQAHPAIAKTIVEATGPAKQRRAVVTVFGFKHDLDRKGVERLAVAIAEGHEDKLHAESAALGLGTVEREVKTEEAEAEDVQAAEPEADETGAPKDTPEAPPPPPPAALPDASAVERDKLLGDIKIARSALRNEPEFTRLVKEAGITGMLSHSSVEALKTLVKSISRAVDQAAAKGGAK